VEAFLQVWQAQTVDLVTKDMMKLTTKLCHVDIHSQEVQEKWLQINYIPTADMTALRHVGPDIRRFAPH
jgi:hypothetical protein